jgi:hypothetical protein
MTKFIKANFQDDGMYVHYLHNGERKYVARFKHGNRGNFMSFLQKNFTPVEYFTQLENSTPVEVLQTKGWLSPNCKRACKFGGYPETIEGYKQMIKDQVAKYSKAA